MRRLVLFLLAVLLTSPMASADIVGIWLFEEDDSIITDRSEKGHDIELYDGYKLVDGKFGKGVELDNTGYMRIEHHEDFNFPEAYTIMIWAKISEITPAEWVGMPRKENEYVLAAHKGAKIEMTMWVNVGGGWIGPIPAVGSGIETEYGEWHHYASTYDGDTCCVYVDGEESGSQQVGGPMNSTDAIVEISKSCSGARFMEAVIDEVVMANEAFTVEQIRDFMSIGVEMVLSVEPQAKLTAAWGSIKSQ